MNENQFSTIEPLTELFGKPITLRINGPQIDGSNGRFELLYSYRGKPAASVEFGPNRHDAPFVIISEDLDKWMLIDAVLALNAIDLARPKYDIDQLTESMYDYALPESAFIYQCPGDPRHNTIGGITRG